MYYTFYPHQILLALSPKYSLNPISPQYLHSYHPAQSHYYFSIGLLCEPPKWVPGSTLVFVHFMLNTEDPVKNIGQIILLTSLKTLCWLPIQRKHQPLQDLLLLVTFLTSVSTTFPLSPSLHRPLSIPHPQPCFRLMAGVLAFLSAYCALSLRCSDSVFPHVFYIFAQTLPEHIIVNGKHTPPWILPIQLVTLSIT